MLQEIIDNHLISKNQKEGRAAGISPSNLGSCIRKLMMMDRQYQSIPYTAQQLRVFKAGYLFERFAFESLRETAGVLAAEQVRVSYRGISGTLDGLINNNGKIRLIDTKSVNSKKFDWLDKEGIDEKYLYQLGFYHLALSKTQKDLCHLASVFYIEKENILCKEMLFNAEEQHEKVNDKIDQIEAAKKEKELPPEKEVIDWECFSVSKKFKTCKLWCSYAMHCPKIKEQYIKTCAEMNITPRGEMV